MSYYSDIYLKRLNQDGSDYKERLQTQRERFFEDSLAKSPYLTTFTYNESQHRGKFLKYRQGDSQVLHYLLTKKTLELPSGTILMLTADERPERPWMVFYLDEIPASGYNRYIMLKMTNFIEWFDKEGEEQSSWAYFYGQEDNMLKNEILGRSRSDTIYTENLKMSFLVMPLTDKMKTEDYFVIREGTSLAEAFEVTGYDTLSQPGVMYVTVDPTPIRNLTPAPEPEAGDDEDEFFWLR